jgi:hypothetical protein
MVNFFEVENATASSEALRFLITTGVAAVRSTDTSLMTVLLLHFVLMSLMLLQPD